MATSKKTTTPILELLRKILNHYMVKNVLILLILCFFIVAGSLLFLRYYTHHGEALSVPDVRGLKVEEAGKVLQSHKMRFQLTDSVYVASVPPGAIVNQNPEPGFKVKEKRTIFLTINAMSPEKVNMPDVVGVSFRQAKTMLESQGLSIGRLTYVPDIARDNVLKQMYKGKEIRKGTTIVKGSEIDLVLGRGLSDEVTNVPSLMGLSLMDARAHLTKYSLNLGVILYDPSVITSADSLKAFVWQQNPEPNVGAMLHLGESIDVWLTVDEHKNPDIIHSQSGE